jgi:hypothetical protein
MSGSRNFLGTLLAITAAVIMGLNGPALAESVKRTNWVPGVGPLLDGELPRGDLWTFRCPANHFFSISVDTLADTDIPLPTNPPGPSAAGIDPLLVVYDPDGLVIASADNEVECSHRPICDGGCPQLVSIPCDASGRRNTYSIEVRDSDGPV